MLRKNTYTFTIQDEGGRVSTIRFPAGDNPATSKLEQIRGYLRDQTSGKIIGEGIHYGVDLAGQSFTEGHYDRVKQKCEILVQDETGLHRFTIPAPREHILGTNQQPTGVWAAEFLDKMVTLGLITANYAYLGGGLGSKLEDKRGRNTDLPN